MPHLDLDEGDFLALQREDPTLQHAWAQVGEARDTGRGGQGPWFEVHQDRLFRVTPQEGGTEEKHQLLVPKPYRGGVLELAHDHTWAGHLGTEKTQHRVLQRFYWPGVYQDIKNYCASCPQCQKTSPTRVPPAPLIPLPIVGTPFERIALDLVGPLEKSSRGYIYILVIIDYATRFPEAVPLRRATAGAIAEELMRLFSRVGLPKELLTDQGTNLTSRIMTELCKLLQVRKLRTSVYHPQTDGLVERFNRTLKEMLRKFVKEDPRDWDQLLPALMFAGAAATFQRLMDHLLRDHHEYAAAYIDDIVIFSRSWEQHLEHIAAVLETLRRANLTANPKKCHFGEREVSYLGYTVGRGRLKPLLSKIQAVRDYPAPTTKKQVRQFLGLAGYYRRFVDNFATVAAPLTDLTRKEQPQNVKWTEQCNNAFERLKYELTHAPVLIQPDFNKPFILQTDASDLGLGAVLAQEEEGAEHPVLYLSRKLFPREKAYATIEKEALALKWAVDSLRYFLLGSEFTLVTDHAPLRWIQGMKDTNPRIMRWYLSLQPYKFEVKHRSGIANGNADCLSRVPERGTGGEAGVVRSLRGEGCDGAGTGSAPPRTETGSPGIGVPAETAVGPPRSPAPGDDVTGGDGESAGRGGAWSHGTTPAPASAGERAIQRAPDHGPGERSAGGRTEEPGLLGDPGEETRYSRRLKPHPRQGLRVSLSPCWGERAEQPAGKK
ncbi:uncharacterized protein LOC142823438 [Pelodiscus sinensis]|uniref:uncharacterized protein LOC142823438 n=1 Tax=Pelodiscus sinensis TaxID=13735 RepID=UPI003F6D1F5B